MAIDTTGGGQAFSALTNAVGQYAFPLSPFITGSLVLVPGDVVWVVVDGVTLVRKTTGAGINAGQFMVPSTTSGLGQAQTTGGRVVGLCMANAASGDANALINVGRSWGEAIP
ncbi:MAG: hypothetical protein RML36_15335 [Anaerolineae bacterium]|nr:hypothetical protein [Anaerolineae bacterium]